MKNINIPAFIRSKKEILFLETIGHAETLLLQNIELKVHDALYQSALRAKMDSKTIIEFLVWGSFHLPFARDRLSL